MLIDPPPLTRLKGQRSNINAGVVAQWNNAPLSLDMFAPLKLNQINLNIRIIWERSN